MPGSRRPGGGSSYGDLALPPGVCSGIYPRCRPCGTKSPILHPEHRVTGACCPRQIVGDGQHPAPAISPQAHRTAYERPLPRVETCRRLIEYQQRRLCREHRSETEEPPLRRDQVTRVRGTVPEEPGRAKGGTGPSPGLFAGCAAERRSECRFAQHRSFEELVLGILEDDADVCGNVACRSVVPGAPANLYTAGVWLQESERKSRERRFPRYRCGQPDRQPPLAGVPGSDRVPPPAPANRQTIHRASREGRSRSRPARGRPPTRRTPREHAGARAGLARLLQARPPPPHTRR